MEEVKSEVTEHDVKFESIILENVDIVKCGPFPWSYKVLIDGVEQKHVYGIELTIEVEDMPRLVLHRLILDDVQGA